MVVCNSKEVFLWEKSEVHYWPAVAYGLLVSYVAAVECYRRRQTTTIDVNDHR